MRSDPISFLSSPMSPLGETSGHLMASAPIRDCSAGWRHAIRDCASFMPPLAAR